MIRIRRTLSLVCAVATFLLGLLSVQSTLAQTPNKWTSGGGSNPDYEMGGNPAVKHGAEGGGYIQSIAESPKDVGNLMTKMPAGPYLGRRVRLSGYVRTENVTKEVLLWIRVDGPNGVILALDNLENRPIKSTTDWKKYDLVADVPLSGVNILCGIILDGVGRAWVDGVTLEAVGPEIAVTTLPPWGPAGANPEDYEMGGNPAVAHAAEGGGYIRSRVADPKGFATLATGLPAGSVLGKRVRLSGYVRTENVETWVGLWMSVEGPMGSFALDNMNSRPIKGTTAWRRYDVVLDVSATATGIGYGLLLSGRGQAWFDGVTLEPVGTEVPVTSMGNPLTEYYAGNYAEAAKLFPDRIARMPTNFSLRLFQFLALLRSGQVNEARTYLAGVASGLTDQKWAGPVVLFYAGRLSEDEVLKAAASADPAIDRQQKCEAYYYLAMAYVLKLGNVPNDAAVSAAKAQEYLEKCVATGVTTYVEYRAANAELQRIKKQGGRS